jgi:hypothetical protein
MRPVRWTSAPNSSAFALAGVLLSDPGEVLQLAGELARLDGRQVHRHVLVVHDRHVRRLVDVLAGVHEG